MHEGVIESYNRDDYERRYFLHDETTPSHPNPNPHVHMLMCDRKEGKVDGTRVCFTLTLLTLLIRTRL